MGFFEDVDKAFANVNTFNPAYQLAKKAGEQAQKANEALEMYFDPANPLVRLGKGINTRVQGAADLATKPATTTKQIIQNVPAATKSVSNFVQHPIKTSTDYFTDPTADPLIPLDIGLGAAGLVDAAGAIGGLTKGAIKATPKTEIPVVNSKPLPTQPKVVTPKAGIPKVKTSDASKIVNKTTPEATARFELSNYQRNLPAEKIPEVTEWQQGVHGTKTRDIENLDTSHFGETDSGFYGHGIYNFDANNIGNAYSYAFKPNSGSYVNKGYNLTPFQRDELAYILDKAFDYDYNILEKDYFNNVFNKELEHFKVSNPEKYNQMVDLYKNLNDRNDIVMGEYLFTDIPSDKYLFSFDDPVATQQILDPITSAINKQLPANATGNQLYESLSKTLGSEQAASEYLNSIGIKGHYVNDPLGREIVVYDGSNTKITGRKDAYNVNEYNKKKWGY